MSLDLAVGAVGLVAILVVAVLLVHQERNR
jgi:hypothetical protein